MLLHPEKWKSFLLPLPISSHAPPIRYEQLFILLKGFEYAHMSDCLSVCISTNFRSNGETTTFTCPIITLAWTSIIIIIISGGKLALCQNTPSSSHFPLGSEVRLCNVIREVKSENNSRRLPKVQIKRKSFSYLYTRACSTRDEVRGRESWDIWLPGVAWRRKNAYKNWNLFLVFGSCAKRCGGARIIQFHWNSKQVKVYACCIPETRNRPFIVMCPSHALGLFILAG